jgi:hypothetical protein
MADLVLLHYEDNTEILVNRDQIIYIEPYNGGASIYLPDGKTLTVKEPPKTVWTKPNR